MIDREALAAALEKVDRTHLLLGPEPPIIAAARERLAQLPGKCGTCEGWGFTSWEAEAQNKVECPSCHGKGVLYPPALVERIAKAIEGHAWGDFGVRLSQKIAVAVLDALNTEPVLDRNTKGTW